MTLTLDSRIQRLTVMMNDGRIIRNDWSGTDEQGRETACLLAALSPEVAEAETASACPAAVMPPWLAYLTPWMDDNCSDAEWPQMIRRYAACANLWRNLDEAAWRRVEISARRAAVVEAMRHTSDEQTLTACRGVLVWLDADMPESSHAAVQDAAASAAWSAAEVAALAAEAADAAAALATAEAADAAAALATADATATAAALAARAAAAESEAADRVIDAVLSALEQECGL